MTVDAWFTFWHDNIVCDLAPNTRRNYQERYKKNVQPVIGVMQIGDVKPMHCKAILNRMDMDYAGSTIRQTYIQMGTMFRSAVWNMRSPYSPDPIPLHEGFGLSQFPYRRACKEQLL